MWCRVVQPAVRHVLLCNWWKGVHEQFWDLKMIIIFKKDYPRICAKNVVNSNLELRRGLFCVGPHNFCFFGTPSVATPVL